MIKSFLLLYLCIALILYICFIITCFMIERFVFLYFMYSFSFYAHALLFCIFQAIWIFSIVDYKEPTYNKGEYKYPGWAIGIGWIIACCSILPIPIFAVIAIIKAKGSNIWEVS